MSVLLYGIIGIRVHKETVCYNNLIIEINSTFADISIHLSLCIIRVSYVSTLENIYLLQCTCNFILIKGFTHTYP